MEVMGWENGVYSGTTTVSDHLRKEKSSLLFQLGTSLLFTCEQHFSLVLLYILVVALIISLAIILSFMYRVYNAKILVI